MATIVIEIPAQLKALVEPIEKLVEHVQRQCAVSRGATRAVDYGRIEEQTAEQVAAVERAAHQVQLSVLDIDERRVRIDGALYTQVLRCPGRYRTMAGEVSVERSLYRQVGVRNAPTVDVVGLRAGVVGDGWLPATASAMAHALQRGTSREAEASGRLQQRLRYSHASYEEVGNAVGQLYAAQEQRISETLIERLQVAAEAVSVSVSVDRFSVPMAQEQPRPPGRPRKDAPKRLVKRVFHQGYAATVTLHDEQAQALHTIRYACMPDGEPSTLLQDAAQDVLAMLGQRPELKVVTLADGAPEMWKLLDSEICEPRLGVKVYRLLDFYHLIDKLSAAAKLIHGDEYEPVLVRWKMWLLNRVDAAVRILDELHLSEHEWTKVGDCCPVHDAITYLTNNEQLMRYTVARRHALPIGSGIAEAACKSFGMRMKRPGSRWKHDGAEHVLKLRALALSDRWDDGMRLTLMPLRRAVHKLAA